MAVWTGHARDTRPKSAPKPRASPSTRSPRRPRDGSQQIVLADDALAVADRVFEEIENLRLQGDQDPAAPQLVPRRIQREIFEGVEQCTTPLIGDESHPDPWRPRDHS